MPSKAHKELCARLMVPDSECLAKIWEIIADESDTSLLLAMPGTISQLAEATSIDPKEIESRLDALFHKGVAFPADKPQGTIFRPPRHLIQFHDASNQWPEAPLAFFDLWKEFMNAEFPKFVGILVSSGFPAFMRTVPSLQAIEAIGQVEPFEDVAAMIEQADQIAVCRCP
ncbi:MAG: hypothetical protein JRJ19_11585, partial [Deltaproteobacteria bacterium]|nr:hypothetical protein [Deltaproteobacteria bacterium]